MNGTVATPKHDRPIGVFDSGVGGLTVVKALAAELPHEQLVYLGDTARVPYGSKSSETVARYCQLATNFLVAKNVKLVIIACNTASALALDQLALPVSVLGVIQPGAALAARATRSGNIGVIGTLGTVRSQAYERAIFAHDPRLRVFAHACPLLVPLAEEGWIDDPIAEAVARRYLTELRARAPQIDVLVLGCTHYPILRAVLERVAHEFFSPAMQVIDSAQAMALATKQALQAMELARSNAAESPRFYVTDETRFAEVGARFLGQRLEHVERVDL